MAVTDSSTAYLGGIMQGRFVSASVADTQQIWAWNEIVPEAIDGLLHALFVDKARELPDALAVDAWDGRFTYAQLDRASTQLASHLIQAGGVGPEMLIPICFEKSAWAVVSMLSVLKAGAAFVPLDPVQPAHRREKIMKQLGNRAAVTIASASHAQLVEGNGRKVTIVRPSEFEHLQGGSVPPAAVSAGCAAYCLFTSGSTGEPKGVIMEHGAVVSSQIHRRDLKGYTQHCRVFQFSSYTFDTCIDEIFMTLGNGGCVCVPSDDDRMNRLASTIQNMSVDLLEVTPTVGRLISPDEVPSVKTIIFGGEYMSQLDFVPWEDKARVINTYGPTECCVECVVSDVTSAMTPGLIGKVVASVSWVVSPDDHNQLAPIGTVGELLVEGPALARGYLNSPQETAQSFIRDPEWLLRGAEGRPGRHGRLYKTGDLVKYTKDGRLVYVGRKDTQVKIHGQRVELGEVESQISKCMPEAMHVVAEVLSYPDGDQALVTFICLSDERAVSTPDGSSKTLLEPMPEASALQDKLFQVMPRYMVPTAFFRSQRLPLTASGKVDRKLLRKAAAELRSTDGIAESAGGVLRPISSKERKLQQLWADILKLEKSKIGIDDSFFQLGGDSVAAIKLAGQARKHGMKLAVIDIFQQPKLCDLAAKAATKTYRTKRVSIPPFSLLGSVEDGRLFRDRIATAYVLHEDLIEDLLPCTPLQEGLLSLTGRDTASEYMIQKVLRISDDIDADRFHMAWEAVIKLLPILRTRMFLAQEHGSLLQGVLREEVHWKQASSLEEYLQSDKAQPMGLGDALARYAIIDNGEERWFVWTIHHCLYDGWTMPRILAMVERAYAHQAPGFGQLTNFNTFIKYFLDRNVQETKEFWTSYLAGAEVTRLPKCVTKTGSTKTRDFIERRQPVSFNNNTSHVPSTVIRAAMGIVLSQRTGSDDIIFGTTVSGRQCPVDGIEDLMGPAIATVPVRLRIKADKTIGEILNAVQDGAIAMIPHEHEGLHNIASFGQSCQDACNFETYLVVQQDDSASFDSGSLGQWEQETGRPNGLSTYPIMVECYLQKNELNIQATFDTETVSFAEMERILDQFYHILEQLLQGDVSRKLNDIELVSMPDLEQIRAWNATIPEPVEELLHDLALRKAQETPDALAIDACDGRFTYSELDIASSYVASLLVGAGVGPEVMVPICFEKSVWAVVAMMAVLKAGGTFVPLDPRQPALRREKITKQAHGPVILASASNAGLVQADGREVMIVGSSLVEPGRLKSDPRFKSAISTDVSPGCGAYILFTSGSTGEPKGVVVPHQAISSSLLLRAQGQGFGPHSRVLQFATYTFDAIMDEIFMTLLCGGCVCIPSDDDIMSNLSGAIRDFAVNTLGLTSTVARLIDPKEVPEISLVILWGEAVSHNDLIRWVRVPRSCTPRLLVTCGPTECCVTCAQYDVDIDHIPHASPIGKAVASRSWIVNPRNHNKLVPVGAIGELLVEGPAEAREYLNNQEKTKAAFIYDPEFLAHEQSHPQRQGRRSRLYKTGDLVRYDTDGNLMYMGRKDAQIKLNGQRVELGEIESHLAHCVPGASHIVADVVTLASGQQVLAAFIKFDSHDTETSADSKFTKTIGLQVMTDKLEIENLMSKRVPRHMIPLALFAIQDVPRSLTGKVDRRRLREEAGAFTLHDLNQKQAPDRIARPMADHEKNMREIWSEILGLEPNMIHITDNFFQLGGNSVTAMKVAGQARRQAINVTVADIFRHPRLCDLAATAKSSTKNEDSTIAPFSLLPSATDYRQLCREIAATHGLNEDVMEDLLPCTPLQEGLLSLTNRGAGDYLVQRVLRISENVELSKLLAAWEAVVAALPILRTRLFLIQGHGIFQGVLRDGVHWARAESLEEYLQSDVTQSTGLGDPLTRYAIVGDGSDQGKWLVWTIHHSLYDAWIMPHILDMVERAYQGLSLGQPIGFGVFIKYLINRDKDKARHFWQSYLAGIHLPELLESSKKMGSHSRGFLQTDRATRFNNKDHVPSTFIRATTGIVLAQLSGAVNDVVFASTVFGRSCPVDGIEDVMGPTIATVPVRVKFQSSQTIKSLLDTLQDQAISMIPYEHEGIQNIRRMSQSCQNACEFQAYVVVQQDDPTSLQTATAAGPLGEWQEDPDRDTLSTYPIMMECRVHNCGITVRTSFSLEVASAKEMETIMDQFHFILEKLLQRSGSGSPGTLNDIALLPASDLKQIWAWNNSTDPIENGQVKLSGEIGCHGGLHKQQASDKDGILGPTASSEERKLQQIWASVLELDPSTVGLNDSFYHLGGDSIAAMKLAAAARASGWSISVSNILKFPTIAQQVTHISSLKSSEPVLAIPNPYSLVSSSLKREILQYLEQNGIQNEVVDILPSTDYQSRTVKETILAPETALNYITLDLGSSVNLELLQNACNILVDNVEILRTVFIYTQGIVWQVVLKSLPIALTNVKARGDDIAEVHDEIWSTPGNKSAFDHPILSLTLTQVPTGGYRLIMGVSHAQYDGLSIPVILKVFECGYRNNSLPTILPFSAYLMLQSNRRASSISYWKKLLESSRLTQGMSRLSPDLLMPINVLQRLEDSRTVDFSVIPEGITVALLANLAWALLLHNVTGEHDIVYVTLVTGRSAPVRGIENVVGPCINLVPVRLNFSKSWTVSDLVKSLQTQFLCLDQSDTMGIDDIREKCTDWPAAPAFDSVFFHQNVDETPEHQLTGVPGKVELHLNPAVAIHRTSVTTYQEGQSLRIKLLTSSHLMTSGGATALLNAFANAFSVLCTNL